MSATARFIPFAPVGGTMWAASPARKSLPWRIGSQTKERICTMLFWKILPSVSVQSSVSRRACISSQIRSSDQFSTLSLGSHWKYRRWISGERVLTREKPRSWRA